MSVGSLDQELTDSEAETGASAWVLIPKAFLRSAGFDSRLVDRIALPPDVLALDPDDPRLHDAIARSVDVLREVCREGRFREAVHTSNPHSYPALAGWIQKKRRPSKDHSGALTMALYLQRFCAKNDSASFFGPVTWIDTHSDGAPASSVIDSETVRQSVFTHWAAWELCRVLLDRPGEERSVRRSPLALDINEERVLVAKPEFAGWETSSVALGPNTRELWRCLTNEPLAVSDLCRLLPGRDIDLCLHELTQTGLAWLGPAVPVGIAAPLQWLSEQLNSAKSRQVLDDLEALREQMDAAEFPASAEILDMLNERFTGLTGVSAFRGAGKFYADRSIVSTDGTLVHAKVDLGTALWRKVESLGPLWDVLCYPIEADHYYHNRAAARWYDETFGHAEVNLIEYLHACVADAAGRGALVADATSAYAAYAESFLAAVLADGADAVEVNISLAEARRRLSVIDLGLPQAGVVLNPDLLIDAPSLDAVQRGDFRLVVGELHSDRDLLSHSSAITLLPPRDRALLSRLVTAAYLETVAGDEIPVEVVRAHLRKTNIQMPLSLPAVEFQGSAADGFAPALAASSLTVRLDNGSLRLHSRELDAYIRLMVGRLPLGSDERDSPLRSFSFAPRDFVLPPADAAYLPRVVIDDVVVQRRQWRFTMAELGVSLDKGWSPRSFLHLREALVSRGIGPKVYAKVTGERKGTYLDLDSFLLVQAFINIWCRHPAERATFVEVLPTRCWLTVGGAPMTSEIRTGFFRRHSDRT